MQAIPGVTRDRIAYDALWNGRRFTLVDTGGWEPDATGLAAAVAAQAALAIQTADAVLLVSDASQEYTAPELEFLRQAVKLCPNVACVLTKTDLYPQWRRIAGLDREHLRTAGIDTTMIGVSSSVR